MSAQRWAGEVANCEPDKCDELRWYELDELPTNVIPYVRQALANVQRGVWFDCFGWD